MLAGVYVLGGLAEKWVGDWGGAYRALLALGQPVLWERNSAAETALAMRAILLKALEPVGIIFLCSLAGALAAGIAQGGGWSLNFEALSSRDGEIVPESGSAQSTSEIGKAMRAVG